MLDLDHFKAINDTFGHAVGDALLVTLAKRLEACVRKTDTVTRLGGDEFVLLFPDVQDRADLEPVLKNIIESVSATMFLDGHEIMVTPSIGACLYPDDAADEGTLMKCADLAMYVAKESGRGNAQWYVPTMQGRMPEAKSMTAALRRSLANGELTVHFQPEVSLRDGSVTGVEALSRWLHPVQGLIPAENFIAAAEFGGFSQQLTKWLLHKAGEECVRLQTNYQYELGLSVNLSSRQFHQLNLPQLLSEMLLSCGLLARQLNIEVTEETLMHHAEQSAAILQQLHHLGVSITIDNFGSGSASLSCLTRFPIDRIKIARALVRNLSSQPVSAAMVEAIIGVAYSLHLPVSAVGVETRLQQSFLQERGCLAAQGRYYGDAVAAADMRTAFKKATQHFAQAG